MSSKSPLSSPVEGFVAPGFERVKRCFDAQFQAGRQIGASLAVWHRGRCVVDLWGGYADQEKQQRWERDTRLVLFSVTKGFVAMAFHRLAERGMLDWDAPVARYWPNFAQGGKEELTVRTLLNHRGGLHGVERRFRMQDCLNPHSAESILQALEQQKPAWKPGSSQGYQAITYGLYAAELFRRIAQEELGAFMHREVFAPTGSDVYLGTPDSEDSKFAQLYVQSPVRRIGSMLQDIRRFPNTEDARIFRDFLRLRSDARQALLNFGVPGNDLRHYNTIPVRRAELAWASATGSAQGIARAYLPFSLQGVVDGRRVFNVETIDSVTGRQGWSERDRVLQKPIGWSGGFVKEAPGVFSTNPRSFGHPGMGGALGWVDPDAELSIGYVPNRMSWRIRSRRALELTAAIYASPALYGLD